MGASGVRFALTGTVVLLVIGSVALLQFMHWRDAPIVLSNPVTIHLQPGDSLARLVAHMRREGIELHPLAFRLLARATGADNKLKAGEYRFEAGATPSTILAQVVAGDVVLHDIRIPEGLALWQLLPMLTTHEVLEKDVDVAELLAGRVAPPDCQGVAEAPDGALEGLLLPETYKVIRGTGLQALLNRACRAMRDVLMPVWEQRDPAIGLRTPYELLVLASIVEKESGMAVDRAQISQVFHRRLALNMRLQTDPTVIYALGSAFDGDLRRADLAVDSPFNTYRYRGLPPTPIALPSRAAIVAAAQPAEGDYLYFVARGDGSSQFSRTLAEHNAAVRKYQLGMSE